MRAYSAMLGAGLVLAAPWWGLRMATTERYREGLRQRLGGVPASLRAAVRGKRVVWVHAVSVGEVLAVSRLVGELGAALGEDGAPGAEPAVAGSVGQDRAPGGSGAWVVVVSTTTRTGQALARERFGVERVFYLPLDFAWAVRAYLRALRPAMVVLAESEVWPRLLHECGRAGVPVAVVNARMSDRSFRRAQRVRRMWGRVLGQVSLWLAQSAEDARRLTALDARGVQVSGNLKYDVRAPGGNTMAALLREAVGDRPVMVAGSTAAGEDELVLRSFQEIRAAVPRAVLVMAPRHPERFAHVLELAEEFGAVRASALMVRAGAGGEAGGSEPWEGQCVVLDTIGDLAAVYRIAEVAFVGGSLIAGTGGHSPLEPAQFGVPVVMGRSYENFRAVVEAMRAEGAICVLDQPGEVASVKEAREAVDGDREPPRICEELTDAMVHLLSDQAGARAMGGRGRQVFEREGGATARSIEALMGLLQGAERNGQGSDGARFG